VLDAVTNEVRAALEVALREGAPDEDALNKIAQRAAGRLLGQKYRRSRYCSRPSSSSSPLFPVRRGRRYCVRRAKTPSR